MKSINNVNANYLSTIVAMDRREMSHTELGRPEIRCLQGQKCLKRT